MSSSSSLMARMAKSGVVKGASTLSESKFFTAKDNIPTALPTLNIALGGKLSGGITPGVTILSGESKSYKTLLGLFCMKAYLDKYPDAIALLYDTEFGITPEYISANGIDPTRIIHIPVEHVEEMKFDVIKRMEEIKRGDHVFMMVDSLGATPSKKEVDDALDEKAVADMTRAKAIRSFFRLIGTHLTAKDIPMVVINHIYKTMELYSKNVQGGGTAVVYTANQIFVITRSQEKEGDEVIGWNFTINVEKSRTVKEKSKLQFTVKYSGGISKWSGLMDLAIDGGYVSNAKKGWYSKVNKDTGEIDEKSYRLKDTYTADFWMPIIKSTSFPQYVETTFKLPSFSAIADEDIENAYSEADSDD